MKRGRIAAREALPQIMELVRGRTWAGPLDTVTTAISAAWPAFGPLPDGSPHPPPAGPTPIIRPQTLIYRASVAAWWTGNDARAMSDEDVRRGHQSICPVCKVVVGASRIRHDRCICVKRCRSTETPGSLVYGDAQTYLESARFNKPGTFRCGFQTGCATALSVTAGRTGTYACLVDREILHCNWTADLFRRL